VSRLALVGLVLGGAGLALAACSSEVLGVLAAPAAAPPASISLAVDPPAAVAAGTVTTTITGDAPGWTQGPTALLEQPDGARWRIRYELTATQVSTSTVAVKAGWSPRTEPQLPLSTPLRFGVPEDVTTGAWRLCRPLRGPSGDGELCASLVIERGTGG
jgi:hypothetical protein